MLSRLIPAPDLDDQLHQAVDGTDDDSPHEPADGALVQRPAPACEMGDDDHEEAGVEHPVDHALDPVGGGLVHREVEVSAQVDRQEDEHESRCGQGGRVQPGVAQRKPVEREGGQERSDQDVRVGQADDRVDPHRQPGHRCHRQQHQRVEQARAHPATPVSTVARSRARLRRDSRSCTSCG